VPSVASSYPVRRGNLVRAWVDGLPAFTRICEVIESARSSVWTTVTILRDGFEMPGGRGGLFDVLDAAVARGLDVRVLFWRHGPETERFGPIVFSGSAEQRRFLAARGSAVKIRWDRAGHGFAQHQKSWIVDAGRPAEVAFVGGINCHPQAVVHKGHPEPHSTHDAYLELAGPAATDVHHNFVQRWNAASERHRDDGRWPADGVDDLAFPDAVGPHRGDSVVQIQRTIHPETIRDPHPAPGAEPFPIRAGERSILHQYLAAITGARHTIYLENQYLGEETVLGALTDACDRGVTVIAVVPIEPDGGTIATLRPMRSALASRPTFLLAGLVAGADARPVYVHDKLMIVDDAWVTIGSANLHRASLHGNAEINASVWDPGFAAALRTELFAEHLGEDTGALSGPAAMRRFSRIATANAVGPPAVRRGLAVALDPRTY
jgi:phosphatidylserine/phosphatidylglycerophosphate/cardiolipin synthase-like enzyme